MTEQERHALLEEMARAMEPEAWAEYDAGNGRCTNQAGWKCMDTMVHAASAIEVLVAKGIIER